MEPIIKASRYKIRNTNEIFIINYSLKGTIIEIIILLTIIIIWIIFFNYSWKNIFKIEFPTELHYFFIFIVPIFLFILYIGMRIRKTIVNEYFKFDKIRNLVLRNKKIITKLKDIATINVDEIDTGMGPIYVMQLYLKNNDTIQIDKNSSFNDISELCKKLNIFLES